MRDIEPIIVKPQDLSLKLSDISERVIHGMMEAEELDVIGLGTATFLACSAVNIATEIASVYMNELYADYVEVPILGKFESIFMRIGREPKIDIKSRIEEEEKEMNLTTEREGQLIAVRKGGRIEKLVTLCLLKFSKVEKVKVIAAASAINDAISLALRLTKGTISKVPIGISFMSLTSLESRDDPTKKVTGISIFLRKGQKTEYSERHLKLVKKLERTRRAF